MKETPPSTNPNPNTHYLGDSVYIQLYGGKDFVLFTNNGDTYKDGTLVQTNPLYFERATLESLLLVLKSNSLLP